MKTIKAKNQDDLSLLKGLQRSDSRAVNAIYDLALPAVIDWVKQNSGSEADARDIFQDALIALYKKINQDNFELTCTLKSYIRIIARNLWLNKLRGKKPDKELDAVVMNEVKMDNDMLERIHQSEQDQLFYRHFDTLGENCKKILQLFFDKTPLKHIATQLDTSENYIKKRKFICKERLIKAVQNDPIFKELNQTN